MDQLDQSDLSLRRIFSSFAVPHRDIDGRLDEGGVVELFAAMPDLDDEAFPAEQTARQLFRAVQREQGGQASGGLSFDGFRRLVFRAASKKFEADEAINEESAMSMFLSWHLFRINGIDTYSDDEDDGGPYGEEEGKEQEAAAYGASQFAWKPKQSSLGASQLGRSRVLHGGDSDEEGPGEGGAGLDRSMAHSVASEASELLLLMGDEAAADLADEVLHQREVEDDNTELVESSLGQSATEFLQAQRARHANLQTSLTTVLVPQRPAAATVDAMTGPDAEEERRIAEQLAAERAAQLAGHRARVEELEAVQRELERAAEAAQAAASRAIAAERQARTGASEAEEGRAAAEEAAAAAEEAARRQAEEELARAKAQAEEELADARRRAAAALEEAAQEAERTREAARQRAEEVLAGAEGDVAAALAEARDDAQRLADERLEALEGARSALQAKEAEAEALERSLEEARASAGEGDEALAAARAELAEALAAAAEAAEASDRARAAAEEEQEAALAAAEARAAAAEARVAQVEAAHREAEEARDDAVREAEAAAAEAAAAAGQSTEEMDQLRAEVEAERAAVRQQAEAAVAQLEEQRQAAQKQLDEQAEQLDAREEQLRAGAGSGASGFGCCAATGWGLAITLLLAVAAVLGATTGWFEKLAGHSVLLMEVPFVGEILEQLAEGATWVTGQGDADAGEAEL